MNDTNKLNRKASKLISRTAEIHALLKCIVDEADHDGLYGIIELAKDANKMANKLEEMTRKPDLLRSALAAAEAFGEKMGELKALRTSQPEARQ